MLWSDGAPATYEVYQKYNSDSDQFYGSINFDNDCFTMEYTSGTIKNQYGCSRTTMSWVCSAQPSGN